MSYNVIATPNIQISLSEHVSLGVEMKTFVIIFLAATLTSCANSPSNLVGKSFDADSMFCQQLRRESISMFRFDNGIVSNRARGTNPQAISHKPASPIQQSDSIKAYEINCESRSAYSSRKKSDDA